MAGSARGGRPGAGRVLAIAAACAALTAVFVLQGFPYALLAQRLAREIGAATGADVSIQDLRPGLSLQGPGVRARGVAVRMPRAPEIRVDDAWLRPAWSLSWLRLAPAVYAEVDAPNGRLAGVFTLGASPGFDGRLERVDLATLPFASLAPGLAVEGLADATIEVALPAEGASGRLELAVGTGSFSGGELPIAVPFEQADAEILLGDGALAKIVRFEVSGPIFQANASGSLGKGPSLERSPLDLSLEYRVEENLRPVLEQAGLSLGRKGSGRVRVAGTLGAPRFQ